MKSISAAIVGGSGYTGGELLRLLLFHPNIIINQVTSKTYLGKYVTSVHPNLRKITEIKFSDPSNIDSCDVLFLCLPHGQSGDEIDLYIDKADRIIDLSSDFRLKDKINYKNWYKKDHPKPDLLNKFIYGIPEIHRREIQLSSYVSCGGCNATASILGLFPLFKHNVLESNEALIDVKVGSSEAGKKFNLASHHPERSGSIRSYKPVQHRHTAEIIQELSLNKPVKIHFSATSVEAVRGLLATCHVFLKDGVKEKDIWKIYREEYGSEPFVRIVKSKDGIYRYPEPKILIGTNYCDVGFELDPNTNRLVVLSAIDNLVKGSAGQAVQSLNIMFGIEERSGLEFSGLHPI